MARVLKPRTGSYLSYTQHSRPGCQCGSREVCGGLLTSLEGVPRVEPRAGMYEPLLSRYGTVTKNANLESRLAAMQRDLGSSLRSYQPALAPPLTRPAAPPAR